MEEKNSLLTIGQFAALHGINKKTLMWYDQIGLFKPAVVNPANGYRFYNYRQSSLLNTILMLREMDVSVEEIQKFVDRRSAKTLKLLLDEKTAELDAKIEHLTAIRETLCAYHKNMEMLLTMDLSEIRLEWKEERCLVTVPIDRDTSYDRQVEMITSETKKHRIRRLHDASYGTMISVDSLRRGDFSDYTGLFIEIPFPAQKTGLHIQPRGRYLQAFYRGDWEKMSAKYQEIFDFAKKHSLKLTGFSYEMILNAAVTDREEDSIVRIEIPAI